MSLSCGFFLFPCRRLDANHITAIPEDSFQGLVQLRHLWLDDNSLTEVPIYPLSNLPSLQALTLALNKITHIPDYAFTNLSSLVVLWVFVTIFRRLLWFCPQLQFWLIYDDTKMVLGYVLAQLFINSLYHHQEMTPGILDNLLKTFS